MRFDLVGASLHGAPPPHRCRTAKKHRAAPCRIAPRYFDQAEASPLRGMSLAFRSLPNRPLLSHAAPVSSFEDRTMFVCSGYAAQAADKALAPFTFERRDPGPTDVAIEIL